MDAAQIAKRFNVEQYQPDKAGRAFVELVNGAVRLRVPYHFITEDGSTTEQVNADGVATEQQLTDLRTILTDVLLATNLDFETENGWTKYTGDV